ncbi:putative exopolyphosphatase [Aspergillus clavatus NRRL 1]|uniref:Exopolyphosphatase, putative n=1 Tax=Aspergillus clavatus (strain ATCC 1007 / CBS 513.65 / DSM 816 / NCTC 3887 / NRRL 1 / QM 1276 / 107) TaxID=344612 RepID=A1C4Z7_ASPCL|nr:exopolyphosphatase, putative [Aspergillus clavatus NRRL 1]EAW14765.1 exopolyphosphatase, putative [Aspergillus clavatus NRRL 1]
MARSCPSMANLLKFLKNARQTHLRFISEALSSSPRSETPIYVIGNPSADLDSIISAIVYSYFAHNRVPLDCPRPHIPLVNLTNVPSGPELRRLRPEFVKAFCLATATAPVIENGAWDETPESVGTFLHDHIITVADFAAHLKQHRADKSHEQLSADATLVDWNALPIRSPHRQRGKGSLDGLATVDFQVLGCIDHHVDENFLPPADSLPRGQPMLVRPAGSCTSLVVSTLREVDRWQDASAAQLAKLAMAAILIDTANLTAKDKVTDSDTDAVHFLTSQIDNSTTDPGPNPPWDRNHFYNQILEAKQSSLDLLTVDEILGRDYKQWTETAHRDGESVPVHIGFCSMVRSIPWIVRKAGGPRAFLESLRAFAEHRELGVVVVMTAFDASTSTSAPEQQGRFCRELVACALDDGVATQALEAFAAQAGAQLGLQEWTTVEAGYKDELEETLAVMNNDAPGWRRIWLQTDVTKSRKQVAPLVRAAVAELKVNGNAGL